MSHSPLWDMPPRQGVWWRKATPRQISSRFATHCNPTESIGAIERSRRQRRWTESELTFPVILAAGYWVRPRSALGSLVEHSTTERTDFNRGGPPPCPLRLVFQTTPSFINPVIFFPKTTSPMTSAFSRLGRMAFRNRASGKPDAVHPPICYLSVMRTQRELERCCYDARPGCSLS